MNQRYAFKATLSNLNYELCQVLLGHMKHLFLGYWILSINFSLLQIHFYSLPLFDYVDNFWRQGYKE